MAAGTDRHDATSARCGERAMQSARAMNVITAMVSHAEGESIK